ncbi:Hypothetical protein ADU72_1239 [Pediococcus damnosus]|uniref:Uncharacterized protein n=1 Tax=Pediococcus damnosus TaxID=51663 RepID=A0AAC9B2K4_9LACO|nr:hypothetical protein [Pediococcus damnosus]AMV60601.1 Hypothetical protein ADU69_0940 [Pediococcus damnosus]AMV62941.1 Hypothetical protein ADU70_1457 [Pediococcus damnosus]AMV64915.1 Hypothetical protein ADU71_1017 [Pediococcus damnosus]AMV67172.1 Hypothetical protein ADU72_1239 [Pediococcus damnosus]AMV69223.1 Hypothetical protein ADU73_0817 [Pediococcus damnosus]
MGFWVLLAAFIVMVICGHYAFKKRNTNKLLAGTSAIAAVVALIAVIYLA